MAIYSIINVLLVFIVLFFIFAEIKNFKLLIGFIYQNNGKNLSILFNKIAYYGLQDRLPCYLSKSFYDYNYYYLNHFIKFVGGSNILELSPSFHCGADTVTGFSLITKKLYQFCKNTFKI